MNRRNFLALFGGMPALSAAGGAAWGQGLGLGTVDLAQVAQPSWQAWKTAYLEDDGRVIDRLQQNSSHSEGQGYGMVLASEFGDADAFRRMFDWTEATLAIRGDALLAWRYLPGSAERVPDHNNASDGDLFYAWALLRAARRFGDDRYQRRAETIAAALSERCILPSPHDADKLLFIPGVQGFASPGHVIINPSYLMPRAMRELAAGTGEQALATAAQHGEEMLLGLAQDGLVPDWVRVTADGIEPAEEFGASAGYEAMRVPLFLVWSGLTRHPAVLQMLRVYERTVLPGAPVPTRIEPASAVVLEASSDPGYRALAALVSCAGRAAEPGMMMPPFDPSQPYYPATLQLLATVAANEVSPECVPL